ncbi:MAG: pitrilysin family protein [Patescibacteria group bacterium]|nr:pitrilysin family protein [Patescibacteria group bacterium]
MYKLKKTKAGLAIITAPVKGIKTVTVMALFGVGSKYENRKNRGAAHFVEHMMFKGTDKRPSPKIISEDLDKIGGEYNAFTGKEYTGYYVKVDSGHLDLALDWISDIILNSQFNKKEMDKERRVILEEMNMCQDNPMQYVEDIYETLIYGDQPAGWEILGTKGIVNNISRAKLVAFKQKNYVQSNCVVCLSGHFGKNIEKRVEKYFSNLPTGNPNTKLKVKEAQQVFRSKMQYKKTDQSHCILGFRATDLFNKERYPLSLIATILGQGMSSRLFLEIREKRGLAYYINASLELYTDSGYLAVQAGLDSSRLEEAVKAILGEFHKMTQEKVGTDELKKAKEYLRGRSSISMESSNAQALYYGNQQILKKKIETLEEKFKILEQVTPADILRVAKKTFSPKALNLAVIGPRRQSQKMKKILQEWYK